MYFAKPISMLLTLAVLLAATRPLSAQQSPPAAGDEAALIAVLESDAAAFNKAKACQQLAVLGTARSVPVLAELLADEQLAHYARFALEPIPDPSVDAALRDALGTLDGELRVGVINSIGVRRDAQAIGALAELLGGGDPLSATAAASSLGKIATPEAVATLTAALAKAEPLRTAVADACLTAADTLAAADKQAEAAAVYETIRGAEVAKHLKIAALHGAIRTGQAKGVALLLECLQSDDRARFRVGLAAAQQLPGDEITQALIATLPELAPPPGEAAKPLAIVKAEYGAGDAWVDVTDKLAAAVRNNSLSIVVGNNLAEDPARGVVKQLRIEYKLDGKTITATVPENQTLSIQSGAVADSRQALLITVLGIRGDRAALPVVLDAAKNGAPGARVAAVRVLADLGDVSAVPVLLAAAVAPESELAAAAGDSLARLPGQQVDAKLAAALAASDGAEQVLLIDLVGRRGVAAAAPALLKLTASDDPQTRSSAVTALGLTVGPAQLPALIDQLTKPASADTAAIAKEALKKAVLRMPDRDACAATLIGRMDAAPTSAKIDLLELLGVVGGDTALKGVGSAAKRGSDEVQDAATRVLGGWMSPDAAPVLLDLATSGSEKFKVRTLRGYIRIVRQFGVPDAQRLAMCRQAMAACGRDAERALVLEAADRIHTPEALAMVSSYLNHAALKQPAARAAVAIGEKILNADPAAVATAMEKVVDAGPEGETAGQAKRLLGQAKARQ